MSCRLLIWFTYDLIHFSKHTYQLLNANQLNCVILEASENKIKSISTVHSLSPEADGVPGLGLDKELPSTGGDHIDPSVLVTAAVGLVVRFSYSYSVMVEEDFVVLPVVPVNI